MVLDAVGTRSDSGLLAANSSRAAKKAAGVISKISDNYIKKFDSADIDQKLAQLSGRSSASSSALSYIKAAESVLSGIHDALSEGRQIAKDIADGKSCGTDAMDKILDDIDALSRTKFGDRYIFDVSDTVHGVSDSRAASGTSEYTEAPPTGVNVLTADGAGNSVLTVYGEHDPVEFTIGFNIGGDTATVVDSSIESGGGTTSLNANINRVSGLSAGQKTALTALAGKLDTQYVPKILSAIAKAIPKTIAGAGGPYSIGLNFYKDSSNTLAYVASSFQTGMAVGGTQNMTLQLSINVGHLDFSGNSLTAQSEADLLGTIAHEMTHAVMDVATSNGMTSQTDRFPHWFIEGVAEVFGGGIDRIADYLPIDRDGIVVNNSGNASNTDVEQIKDQIVSSQKSDYSSFLSGMKSYSNDLVGYSRGYVASMYLGWMAGGKGAITDTNIARGIDTILSDIQGGKSLDTVIKNISGGKYTSAADFQSKMGDQDSSNFMRDFIAASGAKASANLTITQSGNGYRYSYTKDADGGSVIAGGLSKPSSNVYNPGSGSSNFIDLIPENSQVLNNNNILEGGSTKLPVDNGNTPNPPNPPNPPDPPNPPNPPGGGGGNNPPAGGTTGGSTGSSAGTSVGSRGRVSEGIIFQMGARSKDAVAFLFNYGGVLMSDTSSVNVSSGGLGLHNISVASSSDAEEAVAVFDEAIGKVASLRSSLAAYRVRIAYGLETADTTDSESALDTAEASADTLMNEIKVMMMSDPLEAIDAQANVDTEKAETLLS